MRGTRQKGRVNGKLTAEQVAANSLEETIIKDLKTQLTREAVMVE